MLVDEVLCILLDLGHGGGGQLGRDAEQATEDGRYFGGWLKGGC